MLVKGNLTVIALLLSCVLLGPAFVRADTITTFEVSGRYSSSNRAVAPGLFSGTLAVDTDLGRLNALDITFPNLPPFNFNFLTKSQPGLFGTWEITAYNVNNVRDGLLLKFSTNPTEGSLEGFTGGTILGTYVLDEIGTTVCQCLVTAFSGFSGSITPAVSVGTTNVPEPSSLTMLALGLACLPFGFARKKGTER